MEFDDTIMESFQQALQEFQSLGRRQSGGVGRNASGGGSSVGGGNSPTRKVTEITVDQNLEGIVFKNVSFSTPVIFEQLEE